MMNCEVGRQEMDITVKFMMCPVTHCKEVCSIVSEGGGDLKRPGLIDI